MHTPFFHRENDDYPLTMAIVAILELNDEQLEEISGGYIVAGPQGEADWLARQWYAHTHPGTVIPLAQPAQ